jgi:hypothetical protein
MTIHSLDESKDDFLTTAHKLAQDHTKAKRFLIMLFEDDPDGRPGNVYRRHNCTNMDAAFAGARLLALAGE